MAIAELVAHSAFTPANKQWAIAIESTYWIQGQCLVCGVVEFEAPGHADKFETLLATECSDVFRVTRVSPATVRFRVRYWDGASPSKTTRVKLGTRGRMNELFQMCPHSKTLVTALGHTEIEIARYEDSSHIDYKLPTASTKEWQPDREEYGDRHAAVIDLHKYDTILMATNTIVRFDLRKRDIDRILSCGMRYLPTWLFGPRVDFVDGAATRADPPRPRFTAMRSLQALAARAVRQIPGWEGKLSPRVPPTMRRALYNY